MLSQLICRFTLEVGLHAVFALPHSTGYLKDVDPITAEATHGTPDSPKGASSEIAND